jgi:DsbE subfamily thiol:disulfide oxidoreductase
MGGTAGSGERAACNQRSYGKGLGRKNHTTGFRCCADTNVKRELLTAKDLKADDGDLLQRPVPTFEVTDQNGKLWTQKKLRGKVTLLNFFASWCGPCKKEFPYLVKYLNELRSKGLQIVAFGQDSQAKTSFKFAKEYGANFPVAHDEDSKMMGLFRVYSMPTTFLVDRKGIVRYMDTGFKPAEQAAKLRAAIEDLL